MAYHSTNARNLKFILEGRFRIGPGQNCKDYDDIYHPGHKVGVGVYVTLDLKTNEQFDKNNVININGKKYLIALMLRVKPDKIRCPSGYQNFWIVEYFDIVLFLYLIYHKNLINFFFLYSN